MTNKKQAENILKTLYDKGIKEVCLCSGSRNSPFIKLLYAQNEIKVYDFFEERSAGYFALGRIKSQGCPVAVFTTSGTAVGNLFSPMMEAFSSGLPLVVVSADHPRSFKGSGFPQCAEQVGLFEPYAKTKDCEGEVLSLPDLYCPLHINVRFKMPLLDEEGFSINFEKPSFAKPFSFLEKSSGFSDFSDEFLSFLDKKPLVVLGEIPKPFQGLVKNFLLKIKLFVYAEATSGLREDKELKDFLIKGDERFLNEDRGVLRIGGVPSLKFWRNLEEKKSSVFNVSHLPFSGLSWTKQVCSFSDFFKNVSSIKSASEVVDIKEYTKEGFVNKEDTVSSLQKDSELYFFHRLSEIIPEQSRVFLGNSLAIRHWNLVAGEKKFHVFSQRGLNGIDGLVSTTLGVSENNVSTWGVLGDLTALYDLAGLWPFQSENFDFKNRDLKIVVINNGGGKIFRPLYKDKHFENQHQLSFEPWAKMWGLSYLRWDKNTTDFKDLPAGPCILEVTPTESV